MRLRNIPGSKDVITSSADVVQDPETFRGIWAQRFEKQQPLHIEVGTGKGRFLMDMAIKNPGVNYIGIEMYDSVLLRALQKMEEHRREGDALKNVYFIRMDARLLPEVFAEGEVEKIYLNFSDPWPKARNAKRRLTSRQFLDRYSRVLAQNGIVEFKTDNRELFDFSLEEVPEAGWKLLACTFDLHHDPEMNVGNLMTEYEEKFSSMGNPIFKMVITPGNPAGKAQRSC